MAFKYNDQHLGYDQQPPPPPPTIRPSNERTFPVYSSLAASVGHQKPPSFPFVNAWHAADGPVGRQTDWHGSHSQNHPTRTSEAQMLLSDTINAKDIMRCGIRKSTTIHSKSQDQQVVVRGEKYIFLKKIQILVVLKKILKKLFEKYFFFKSPFEAGNWKKKSTFRRV